MIGCATTPAPSKPAAEATQQGSAPEAVEPAPTTEAESMAAPAETGFQGNPLDDPSSPLAKRVIYFDFDKSDIRDEFRNIISAHAGYLADHPSARVVLEGHTDERGTREYNMALGERRANSVAKLLKLQGASDRQIETVSYGEERPVAMGHDEASWRLNRRVEIIYKSR